VTDPIDGAYVPVGRLFNGRPGSIVALGTGGYAEYHGCAISSNDENAFVHPFERLPIPTGSPFQMTLIRELLSFLDLPNAGIVAAVFTFEVIVEHPHIAVPEANADIAETSGNI
jgi:hypothetical protein